MQIIWPSIGKVDFVNLKEVICASKFVKGLRYNYVDEDFGPGEE